MWGWGKRSGTGVVPCQGGERDWGGGSGTGNDGALGFRWSSIDPTVATEGSSSLVCGYWVGSFLRRCGPVSVASQCDDRSVILL